VPESTSGAHVRDGQPTERPGSERKLKSWGNLSQILPMSSRRGGGWRRVERFDVRRAAPQPRRADSASYAAATTQDAQDAVDAALAAHPVAGVEGRGHSTTARDHPARSGTGWRAPAGDRRRVHHARPVQDGRAEIRPAPASSSTSGVKVHYAPATILARAAGDQLDRVVWNGTVDHRPRSLLRYAIRRSTSRHRGPNCPTPKP